MVNWCLRDMEDALFAICVLFVISVLGCRDCVESGDGAFSVFLLRLSGHQREYATSKR